MRARNGLRLLFAVGLSTLATGCSGSTTPLVCTDIGCFNGLTVRLAEPLPDGTVVSLRLQGAPWTVTCGEIVDCSEVLYFEGLHAEYLGVRVVTPTGEVEFDFRPDYRLSRPNGPDCPPECFHAEITLSALDPS